MSDCGQRTLSGTFLLLPPSAPANFVLCFVNCHSGLLSCVSISVSSGPRGRRLNWARPSCLLCHLDCPYLHLLWKAVAPLLAENLPHPVLLPAERLLNPTHLYLPSRSLFLSLSYHSLVSLPFPDLGQAPPMAPDGELQFLC